MIGAGPQGSPQVAAEACLPIVPFTAAGLQHADAQSSPQVAEEGRVQVPPCTSLPHIVAGGCPQLSPAAQSLGSASQGGTVGHVPTGISPASSEVSRGRLFTPHSAVFALEAVAAFELASSGFDRGALQRGDIETMSRWRLSRKAMETWQNMQSLGRMLRAMSDVSRGSKGDATSKNGDSRFDDDSDVFTSAIESEQRTSSACSACCCWAVSHLPTASPAMQTWIARHLASQSKFLSIAGFIFLDVVRRDFEELTLPVLEVNPMSVSVMSHLLILILTLTVCLAMDGSHAFSKLVAMHSLWRWGIVAALIIAGFFLQAGSVHLFKRDDWVEMLSCCNLPLALLIGHFAFRKVFQRLELLAVCMMTLGIGTFTVLRVRCMREDDCSAMNVTWDIKKYGAVSLMVGGVVLQMMAWTYAEWVLKAKSPSLRRHRSGCHRREPVRVMLAQLAFCQFVIGSFIWVSHGIVGKQSLLYGAARRPDWFGEWHASHYVLVFVYACHKFLSFHVIKRFSTISWVVCQIIASVLYVLTGDSLMNQYSFGKRATGSLLIAPIIVLSALIYQTGRLNIQVLRDSMGEHYQRRGAVWSGLRCAGGKSPDLEDTMGGSEALAEPEPEPQRKSRLRQCAELFAQYSVVIVYILAQACRENLSQKAQSDRIIVPQSLNVACAVSGLVMSNLLTLSSHGVAGLKEAWNLKKICKFMLPAMFFALSAFLGSMSFALGTSAAAKDAAGRIYTPITALLSRYILGKFYMWLEWLALIILTLSCMTFGLLEATDHSSSATMGGLLCAVGSGVVAAMNSLLMEKLMKGEDQPFVVQNVRLTFGSAVFNVFFLFVMGWIGEAEQPQRLDFAFWRARPLSQECALVGTCAENGFEVLGSPRANLPVACECGSGIFVGWGSQWMVYAALASAVLYSWVTGLLVKQFSSVYRSVADGLMLMVVFFALTPLLNGTPFPINNAAACFVVLIVPFSGTTFDYAKNEMQKVMEVVQTKSRSSNTCGEASSNIDSADTGSTNSGSHDSDSTSTASSGKFSVESVEVSGPARSSVAIDPMSHGVDVRGDVAV